MRSRRIIPVLFLLLANVAMLAHAAIPHHHHKGEVRICFFDSPCNDCTDACHHERRDVPDHKCCIDEVYTPATNEVKTTCPIHKNCTCGQLLYAVIPNSVNIRAFADDTVIRRPQKPDIPLFYSEFIAQSGGLRAPPAC